MKEEQCSYLLTLFDIQYDQQSSYIFSCLNLFSPGLLFY